MVRNSGNGGVVLGEGGKKVDPTTPILDTIECDSTTSAVIDQFKKKATPTIAHSQFEVDEDVYYQEMEGKNVLGTVELINGKKIKIKFMDGTERWAPASRLKKITVSFRDEEEEEDEFVRVETSRIAEVCNKAGKKGKKVELFGGGKEREVTCGSCGTQKMITSKKAVGYSPFTSHQYNCRKCINKSKTSKNNNGVPIIAAAHYLAAAAARGRPRSTTTTTNNDMMMLMMGPSSSSVQSKAVMLEGSSGSGSRASISGSELDVVVCLHCRTQIMEKVSLHCTMCERPCHPSCLALTPPPMAGDIFWSIICHVCGTQKPTDDITLLENDSQKLYSSRRSITCWSDVAYLLLSCMGCRHPNERFFDLDEQVIPFWEENLSRLHLPRQYKQADPTERRRSLLVALNNANLRFTKDERKSPVSPTTPLFAIKDRCLNVLIKQQQQQQQQSRAVTAAGFPIQIRANNLETTSVVMSNIAQTIAVQAAANKSVPSPKNSPTTAGGSAATGGVIIPQKAPRPPSFPAQQLVRKKEQIAKKSGSEVNVGAQRSAGWGNKIETTAATKPKAVLTPSPGGAARCMIVQSPSAAGCDSGRVGGVGSFPVRKNGSPAGTSKFGKVEGVVKVGEYVRELVNGFGVKRKLEYPSEDPTATKKLKMITHLPSSTDVTPKRVISAEPLTISPSSSPPSSSITPPKSPKKSSSMSPLQKLSDLQRNGGLTVACLTHNGGLSTASGSLEGAVFEEVTKEETVTKLLLSSSSEGCESSSSPVEKRVVPMVRPVRVKRSVVAAKAEKKKVEERVKLLNKSRAVLAGKGISSSSIMIKGRGRPRGGKEVVDRAEPEPLADEVEEEGEEFRWGAASVNDLLRFGVGYRVGVLPQPCAAAGAKHFANEVVLQAPPYWGNGSRRNRDLKELDSYVVCGRRVVEGEVQYQVVWGCCGDDDEEETEGVKDDEFFRFEDYDHLEYFFDRMPVQPQDFVKQEAEVAARREDVRLRNVVIDVVDLTDSP